MKRPRGNDGIGIGKRVALGEAARKQLGGAAGTVLGHQKIGAHWWYTVQLDGLEGTDLIRGAHLTEIPKQSEAIPKQPTEVEERECSPPTTSS